MPFSLNGTTIVQTGTDTDLSGLVGISGVTVDDTQYTLDNRRLEINGNLTMNGFVERLRFINSPTSGINDSDAQIAVRTGATFTVEASRTLNGDTVNRVVPVIDFGTLDIDFGTVSFNGVGSSARHLESDTGSTVNLSGVLVANTFSNGLAYAIDGTANLIDVFFINQGPGGTFTNGQGGNQQVAFARGGDIVIENCNAIGYSYTDRGGNFLSVNGISVAENSEGFVWNGVAFTEPQFFLVEGFDPAQIAGVDWRTNVTPVAATGSVAAIRNSRNGNATTYSTNQAVGRQMRLMVVNSLRVTPVNGNFAPITATVFARDVDNGNRGADFTPPGQAPVLASGDIVYLQTGSDITFEVLSGIFNPDETLDNRGIANGGDLSFVAISYNNNIAAFQPNLTGLGEKSVSPIMLVDQSITEPSEAVANGYTTIDDPFEFYDAAKAFLVSNFNGETETIVARTGSAIDARGFDVVIDASAPAAFDFDGSTITINTPVFTGDITTTGTVSVVGGAQIVGVISDSNGTTGVLTLL